MKSVQLFPNVRYVSLSDEEGSFGMFLVHEDDYVYQTYEVHDREEFVRLYDQLANVNNEVAA